VGPVRDPAKCRRDVQQQMLAKHYAALFNAAKLAQTIDFLQVRGLMAALDASASEKPVVGGGQPKIETVF